MSIKRLPLQASPTTFPSLLLIAFLFLGVFAGSLVVVFPHTLKLLVTILALGGVILSVINIKWGLYVLVFITYTRFSDIAIAYHGAPSVAKSFIFILLLAILLRWVLFGKAPTGWQQPAILLFLFGFVALTSIFYAEDPGRTQAAFIDFLKNGVIVLIIAVLLQKKSDFRYVIWTLLAAGIFMGTLTVIQYATKSFHNVYGGFAQYEIMHIVGQSSGPRVSGPVGDPNFYAQIMIVLIPIGLDRFWSEEKPVLRLVAVWAVSVCLLSVLFTFSRGAFLALAMTMLVTFIFHPPKFSTLAGTIIISLLLVPFIPQGYTQRMLTLTEIRPSVQATIPQEDSFRGRTSELWSAWLMFLDHPILGVGFNNFPVHYIEYSRQLGIAPQLKERAAHNLYIEIAAELGLVGLSALGLILWKAGQSIWNTCRTLATQRRQQESRMVLSMGIGVLGYLAAAVFIHDAYPRYLWMLLGICLATSNLTSQEHEAGQTHVH